MNQEDPSGPDEIDKAWLASIVPDGCLATGFVGIAHWIDPEGAEHWRVYSQIEAPISTTIGLLELAKLELIARTDTGLPIRYPELEEGDDT